MLCSVRAAVWPKISGKSRVGGKSRCAEPLLGLNRAGYVPFQDRHAAQDQPEEVHPEARQAQGEESPPQDPPATRQSKISAGLARSLERPFGGAPEGPKGIGIERFRSQSALSDLVAESCG